MRTGLACDDWVPSSLGNEDKMYQQKNWLHFFLALPQSHEVGSHFSYCTGGAILLGHILNDKLHGKIRQWADQRLFSKLNIADYHWSSTPNGQLDTGGHIYMKAVDLVKIGQLLLNNGRYSNQQVIPAAWVEKLFTAQTRVYERPYHYSYWWWLKSKKLSQKDTKNLFMFAWGNGGQYLFVIPKQKMVIVFTGSNFNSREMLKPQIKVIEWLQLLK
jgi:CubicO group peptidase (beta-lactamase class C family)